MVRKVGRREIIVRQKIEVRNRSAAEQATGGRVIERGAENRRNSYVQGVKSANQCSKFENHGFSLKFSPFLEMLISPEKFALIIFF